MSDQAQTPLTPTPESTSQTTPDPATPLTPETVVAPETPASVLDEPKGPEPFDPEKLTVPDGFDREAAPFKEFTNLAKESGFTGEQAQKLVDFHLKHSQANAQALQDGWTAQQEKWVAEVKADREIGNLDTLRQTIAKVADNPELTDPEFKQALAFTGAGNHPAVLRTLMRWAKALSEGGPVAGAAVARDGRGALANQPQSLAEAFYGPSGPHTGGPKLS